MPKKYETRQYRGYHLLWQYLDKKWDVLSPGQRHIGTAKTLTQAKKMVDKAKGR